MGSDLDGILPELPDFSGALESDVGMGGVSFSVVEFPEPICKVLYMFPNG